VCFILTVERAHDSTTTADLLAVVNDRCIADKAYDTNALRELIGNVEPAGYHPLQKLPQTPNPTRRNRRKLRNRIERFFNKLNTPETSLRATIAAPSIFLPHSTSPAL